MNGGTTTTSKPSRAPSDARAAGVPRRSKPNAASGVIRKPLRRDPRADPLDEDVVRRRAQRGIEVLDDGHLDAGRLESLEPLDRVEQERRRLPDEDLVGMMVEGDDGRSRGAGRGLADQVPEQVGVAEVEAVEHADDDEDRAEVGLERLDALDRRPSPVSGDRGGRRGCRGRGDEDLVGGEPTACRGRDGHERAGLVPEPVVVGGSGQAARRADELAAGDGGDLLGGQGHHRKGVESVVDRSQQRDETRRVLGGGRADRRRAAGRSRA